MIQEMKIDQIHLAGDTQIRVQLDLYAVNDYVRAMQDGDVFPPVDVFFDGDVYWLADGFHRVESAKKLERETISAKIHRGDKRDAILFAIDTNQRYGVRLNNRDKQNIVKMFLTDAVWGGWSDREIGRRCGVHNETVAAMRSKLSDGFRQIEKPTHRKARRNGKDYTVNVANIGKLAPVEPEPPQSSMFDEPEPEPLPAPAEEPELPMSQVTIINADAQYLSQVVTEPAHLVITSPPYNVGVDYADSVDDLSTYIPLVTEVWRQCYKVMVDGARIAVVVPYGIGRNPYVPFDCQIMATLVDAGFTLRGRIVWDKNTTGNRTTWGSFRLPSDPAIRDTTECIIVAHKGEGKLEIPPEYKRKDDKGTYALWLSHSEYFMMLAQDHWIIAPESAQRIGHPAPFPVELADRLIRLYTYPGAHIVDPFAGSGTVGVAAKKLGCNATLVEISQAYCELAKERLNQ